MNWRNQNCYYYLRDDYLFFVAHDRTVCRVHNLHIDDHVSGFDSFTACVLCKSWNGKTNPSTKPFFWRWFEVISLTDFNIWTKMYSMHSKFPTENNYIDDRFTVQSFQMLCTWTNGKKMPCANIEIEKIASIQRPIIYSSCWTVWFCLWWP